MTDDPPFHPAWWLGGPNLQTVWGRLVRPRRLVPFRREVLETPDGDDLALDHADAPSPAPRAVLLHGLEGSSNSVYMQGLAAALRARGLSVTALNFRSCACDPRDGRTLLPNRRPRLYHSGETGDLGFVLETLARREPATPLVAAGVSLGGNVLLKWLGENPGSPLVRAAAALSVPFDLASGARFMESGPGPTYVRIFLKTLRAKALDVAERYPEARALLDLPALGRARTFFEFDDAATAPLHGFASAADYYERSSSLQFLPRVTVPVLAIGSEDDPFVPADALFRARAAAPPNVTVLATSRGGHVGFVTGLPLSPVYWAETRLADFLAAQDPGGPAR